MEQTQTELTGSTVIWAIMAVTGLWLVGLFALGIGYTFTECLRNCTEPAPRSVWWISVAISGVFFLLSGRVAVRMTRLTWTWLAAAPGFLFLLIVSI